MAGGRPSEEGSEGLGGATPLPDDPRDVLFATNANDKGEDRWRFPSHIDGYRGWIRDQPGPGELWPAADDAVE